MSPTEQALKFECSGHKLVGIVHSPIQNSNRGVLIIVGGPQYRVGSHRQFVLLAKALAAAGIPTMRFDFRGMGDSEGDPVSFEQIDPDISSAIDAFSSTVPQLREVVLWGLCDAASGILFYAHQDPRVCGIVLLNPWVRTEKGMALAYLRHYYVSKIVSQSFWRNVLSGSYNFRESSRSFSQFFSAALGISKNQGNTETLVENPRPDSGTPASSRKVKPLPDRMLNDMRRFKGPTLIVLSGNDLTADEFRDTVAASKKWQKVLDRETVTIKEMREANHTFSRRKWRDQLACWTIDWVKSL